VKSHPNYDDPEDYLDHRTWIIRPPSKTYPYLKGFGTQVSFSEAGDFLELVIIATGDPLAEVGTTEGRVFFYNLFVYNDPEYDPYWEAVSTVIPSVNYPMRYRYNFGWASSGSVSGVIAESEDGSAYQFSVIGRHTPSPSLPSLFCSVLTL
jgi:hypothetical protein